MDFEDRKDGRPCPKCGGTMELVRTPPRLGAFPELKTYWCDGCDEVITVERKP
jgi:ssDNA-binding Zn-finger/Zn-ribbon topoisomerase 1